MKYNINALPKNGLLNKTYKFSGIYAILNEINNKIYVGSSKYIGERLNEHKYDLIKNIHSNNRLQKSFLKYGIEKFIFILLEKCDENVLLSREQFYMDFYRSYDKNFGYNICPTANRTVISEETRNWFLINNKGSKNNFFGKNHTEEKKEYWRKTRKNNNLGKDNSNYGNRGVKNPIFGRKHTEEELKKIIEIKKCSKIKVKKGSDEIIFENRKLFAEFLGCNPSSVYYCIRKNIPINGYTIERFKKINEK
jgi:group I intron endonuclease